MKRSARASLPWLVALLAACDIEPSVRDSTSVGPTLHVVGSNIDTQQGVVAADGVLQIAFDRYLLPSTITRQSYAVLDGDNVVFTTVAFRTTYDPIARVVTIAGPEGPGRVWLTPPQSYKLVLTVPSEAKSDIGGFRAIDRATLSDRRVFVFRAGPPAGVTALDPSIDFCRDVMPMFAARCAGGCHAGPTPTSGLALDTEDGVHRTLRFQPAIGTSVEAYGTSLAPTPSRFGTGMARVLPFDPGSSYLLYKLELAPLPEAPIEAPNDAGAFAQVHASADERTRLAQFIVGREMPYGDVAALTFEERERLRAWIAQGADIHPCGSPP